jgi:hypothetical protein
MQSLKTRRELRQDPKHHDDRLAVIGVQMSPETFNAKNKRTRQTSAYGRTKCEPSHELPGKAVSAPAPIPLGVRV